MRDKLRKLRISSISSDSFKLPVLNLSQHRQAPTFQSFPARLNSLGSGRWFSWPCICIASVARQAMLPEMQDRQDHFAYCVQLFGGTTAFSRRLRIDERAVRRFINGERPISDSLLRDTSKALGELVAEANAAAETISATLSSEPSDL